MRGFASTTIRHLHQPARREAAVAEAEALAARDAATLPLYGVPVAVKDNIDVAGLPTTAACPAFSYSPSRDSTAVARLRAAGAIVVGKTNLDQFATGLSACARLMAFPSIRCAPISSGRIEFGLCGRGFDRAVPLSLGTDTGEAAGCPRCSTTSSG